MALALTTRRRPVETVPERVEVLDAPFARWAVSRTVDTQSPPRWHRHSFAEPANWTPRKPKARVWPADLFVTPESEIDKAIRDARSITTLPDDWDDDGAKQISVATFDRAASLLRHSALYLRALGIELPPPRIGPCPDGSIDLYWKQDKLRLLMNVQPNGKEGDFFGESARNVVKGLFRPETFDPTTLRWLFQE